MTFSQQPAGVCGGPWRNSSCQDTIMVPSSKWEQYGSGHTSTLGRKNAKRVGATAFSEVSGGDKGHLRCAWASLQGGTSPHLRESSAWTSGIRHASCPLVGVKTIGNAQGHSRVRGLDWKEGNPRLCSLRTRRLLRVPTLPYLRQGQHVASVFCGQKFSLYD